MTDTTIRESIVNIAKNQVGTKEDPDGSNKTKYGEWFEYNGVPWCAILVSWIYAMAGVPLPAMGWPKGVCSVPFLYGYASAKGCLTIEPQGGDAVIFDWPNTAEHYDHVETFIEWIDRPHGTFRTVGGNWGNRVQDLTRTSDHKVCFIDMLKLRNAA